MCSLSGVIYFYKYTSKAVSLLRPCDAHTSAEVWCALLQCVIGTDHMRMCPGRTFQRTCCAGRRHSAAMKYSCQSFCTWALHLAKYPGESAKRDKRAAVSSGARIIQHLLCLKYANDHDFDSSWKRSREEVCLHAHHKSLSACPCPTQFSHVLYSEKCQF